MPQKFYTGEIAFFSEETPYKISSFPHRFAVGTSICEFVTGKCSIVAYCSLGK